MKVSSLAKSKTLPSDYGFIMQPLFGPETKPREAVHMGKAVFTPGMRVPRQGTTLHDGDEFSYILSGTLRCVAGGEEHVVQAGDALFIPAGETHYSLNASDADCELIYMLVKTV